MMKKMMLCCAVMLVAGTMGMAQVGELHNYAQGKVVARSYEPHFIGSDGQVVYLVQEAGRLRDKLELASFDMEQNELARVPLGDDKETKCYGGYLNPGGIDLLMAQWEGDNMKVYRDRHHPQTLQPEGEPMVLADYKGTKGDQMAFAINASANQELLAGVYLVGREGQNAEVQVGLYSRELEEYWKMDTRCRRLDFIHVTDSGDVLLGSLRDKQFELFVLDGEHERSFTFEAEDSDFAEVALVRYAGGKVYLAASHSAKTKKDGNGTLVDYIASICFDTRRNTVSTDRHYIDQTECNRLYNEKDNMKIRKNDFRVQYMNLMQTVTTPEAGYVMFDQMWSVSVDGVMSTRNRCGMMVAKIGNDGHFEWLRTFRISTVANWLNRAQLNYRWQRTGRGLMLVWSESKSKKELPEEVPVKAYSGHNSSGMLTALLLDSDGNMQRQHFDMQSKQTLLGHPYALDNGEYLMMIRGVSRGYFAKLKLQ